MRDDVVVWGIGPDDSLEALIDFRDELGVTFPILYDEDGVVHAAYQQAAAFDNTVYPQDWIVAPDGTVAYVNSSYDLDAMLAVLDSF